MENYLNNLDKIKQPKPSISANTEGGSRIIQKPYVGIISDVNPTRTPVSDTVEFIKQQTRAEKYKPIQVNHSIINFDNIATGGIITCGILGLLSLLKRK